MKTREKATARSLPFTIGLDSKAVSVDFFDRGLQYPVADIVSDGLTLDEQYANAELIVRAVNNFDSLLEACKKMDSALCSLRRDYPRHFTGYLLKEWERVKQAIAQAEKEG